MILIDIDADLNVVDDEDRNMARRLSAVAHLGPGDVAVAGKPGFWSWVQIDEVTDTSIYFHQISAREAATHGELAVSIR